MKRHASVWVVASLLLAGVWTATAMTANEILDEMENLFSVDAEDERGVLAGMTIHNEYTGGVTSEYTLAMFELTVVDATQPGETDEVSHVIMYFLGGDEDGSIFLMETPQDESADDRMWLYLPALGLTKELVSDEDQSGSFAGSSISYGDLGGTREFQDDYDGTILREEQLEVDGEPNDVWVLELIASPGADTDYSKVLLWVAKEDYLALRMEAYNELGSLDMTMDFRRLGWFEDERIPEVILSQDFGENTTTTITLSNTRRPDVPLTLDLFDPSRLSELDPAAYGF